MSANANLTVLLSSETYAVLEVMAERENHALDEQIQILIQQGIDEYKKTNKIDIVLDLERGDTVIRFQEPLPPKVPF